VLKFNVGDTVKVTGCTDPVKVFLFKDKVGKVTRAIEKVAKNEYFVDGEKLANWFDEDQLELVAIVSNTEVYNRRKDYKDAKHQNRRL
jgi:hypothetical protein